MGERSIHCAQIALSRQAITIPWTSRQALLERLRPLDSMREVVSSFWAVGTSRPVDLTQEQQADLLEAIRAWSQEVPGGYASLPEGIEELHTRSSMSRLTSRWSRRHSGDALPRGPVD